MISMLTFIILNRNIFYIHSQEKLFKLLSFASLKSKNLQLKWFSLNLSDARVMKLIQDLRKKRKSDKPAVSSLVRI